MKSVHLLLLMCMPLAAMSQSGAKNFIDQNYIEVVGTSEMEIIPDLIYIHILITEKDNKTKLSLAERERTMILKLKEIGINTDKDLLIKEIVSNFQYSWLSRDEILLSKQYQLLVKDGKTASRVFVELERLGISNAGIEKLDNTQIEKYRREVKVEAIKAGKSKAEALVGAIGQNIGKSLFIEELQASFAPQTSNSVAYYNNMKSSGYQKYDSSPENDMDFEKIRLTSSILVRFELK